MRLEHLQTFDAPDGRYNTSFVKGHLNGIVVFADVNPSGSDVTGAKDSLSRLKDTTLSIKYVHEKTDHIMTSMKCKHLLDISDMKNGSVTYMGQAIAGFINTNIQAGMPLEGADLDWYEHNLADWQLEKTSKIAAFYVDLGSIYIDNGSEIKFDFNVPGHSTNGLTALSIYALSSEKEPFHILQYDTDIDKNEVHQKVSELFLLQDDISTLNNFDIQVDSDSTQFSCDVNGLRAYSMLFSKLENRAIRSTLKLYENSTPEDVKVKIIGETADTTSVMAVRVKSYMKKFEENQAITLEAQAVQIEKFEKSDSETAQVLINSGMPSPEELRQRAQEFKE